MIDPTQILLFAVVIILTILLVIIGWQIYLILCEVRKMLIKSNTIMDSTVSISQSIGKSFNDLSGFTEGLKAVLNIFNLFKPKEKYGTRKE